MDNLCEEYGKECDERFDAQGESNLSCALSMATVIRLLSEGRVDDAQTQLRIRKGAIKEEMNG